MPDADATARTVTIVLLEDDGPRALEPVVVPTPWWPDVGPIVAALPGIAILRLLDATPAPGHPMGGQVTYLAERLPTHLAARRRWPSVPYVGALRDDPLRQPWARPGGPLADLEWALSHVELTAPPVQARTWNLSAIWRLATPAGGAWLKCVAAFGRQEAAVLAALGAFPVPRLLASDGHRELLAEMPGVDGYDATLEERRMLVDRLVEIQRWSAGHVDDLLGRGVPDRRIPVLLSLAADLVARIAPRDGDLAWLLETGEARAAAIDACGLPDVLVHGDAHPGNARVGAGSGGGVWFDWSDARVGHPLIDLAVLERPGTAHARAIAAHWLARWRSAVPGSDPDRAWSLLRPLAALGDAVVYQGFLDRIEASEQRYHRDDVAPCLARAARLAAAERQQIT